MTETADIYRSSYWNKIGGDTLADQSSATVLFDASVLCGVQTVVVMAQSIATGLRKVALLADGVAGPKTLAAINSCDRLDFLTTFIVRMQRHFVDIVTSNPDVKPWLANWLGRCRRWLELAHAGYVATLQSPAALPDTQ